MSNFADSSHNWDHQQLIINFVHPEFPITSLLWQDESCSSLNCLRHCYYLLPTFWYNLKKKIQIQSYSGDEQKLGQRSGSPWDEYSYSTAKIFLARQFNKHSLFWMFSNRFVPPCTGSSNDNLASYFSSLELWLLQKGYSTTQKYRTQTIFLTTKVD